MSISPVNTSWMTAVNGISGADSSGRLPDQGTDQTISTQDSATLSPQALRLSSLFGTEPGKAVTLADLRAFAEGKLQDFAKRFRALLEANGVDLSQPITLGHEPGSGRLVVTNKHPDAKKIEQLLAQQPELCNTYTAATSTLAIAKQGEEHNRFAQAYEQNPQAAVAQFRYLFDTQWNAEVTFAQDGFDVTYNRQPRGQPSVLPE